MRSTTYKRTLAIISLLLFAFSAFSVTFAELAPREVQLNTEVEPYSALTVNNGQASASIPVGSGSEIGYTYQGNQLVNLTVTSTNGMKMVNQSNPSATIAYSMTLDYGNGHVAVVNGVANALVDNAGTYDLSKSMVVTPVSGMHVAGTYSDTLTFTITANL